MMEQNGQVKQRKGGKEKKKKKKKKKLQPGHIFFICTRRHTEKQSND
jgi:hypothetical protein